MKPAYTHLMKSLRKNCRICLKIINLLTKHALCFAMKWQTGIPGKTGSANSISTSPIPHLTFNTSCHLFCRRSGSPLSPLSVAFPHRFFFVNMFMDKTRNLAGNCNSFARTDRCGYIFYFHIMEWKIHIIKILNWHELGFVTIFKKKARNLKAESKL